MAKRIKNKFYPAAMSIAVCDPCGGSGIAADLRTFNAFGVFGTGAVTAIAGKNPEKNGCIALMDAAVVRKQMEKILENTAICYLKTGMLFSAEMVSVVAAEVKKHQLPLVCDPVMFSKNTGSDLAEAMNKLFALASWITPGIPEAEALTGRKITSPEEMIDTAKNLAARFQCNILLKGGKLPEMPSMDAVIKDGKAFTLTSPVLELPANASLGAGSAFSAALTAMLALDFSWKQAVCSAKAFVYGSLCQMVEIGSGINAMYPPAEDYSQMIKLSEAE